MSYGRLSEAEQREFNALSPSDRERYRNIRGSGIRHRTALGLIAKWAAEDSPDGPDSLVGVPYKPE